MKRLLLLLLLVLVGVQAAVPADAARRVGVRRGPYHRTVVVVNRGWPIRRPLRAVVVRPVRSPFLVRPAVFMPMVVWTGVVVATPPIHDALIWEDGETIDKDEDWTEVGLGCHMRGTGLWLEVAEGRAQFDWAEVVFENGDTRVVDMKEWTRGPGLYPLIDFRDGRKVDHVRLVARAKSDNARIVLKLER